MKALGLQPRAFIVFECWEILMKHEPRVYEMASQKGLIILLTINTKTERPRKYSVFVSLSRA